MTMETLDHPVVKPKVIKPTGPKNYKAFIKASLPIPNDRTVTKISMTNVSPSYWRINVWGKKANSTCMFGDNEIIMSKFIRIDIDKDGNLVYNDVTEGKEL